MKLKLLKFLDKVLGVWLRLRYKSQMKATALPKCPKTIAVIKTSALGDALCLMPSLQLIKQWYPNTHLIWLTTTRSFPSLFKGLPFLDEISIYPTSWKLFSFVRKWQKRQIDICIDADQYYQISHWFALSATYSVSFTTPIKPPRLTKHLSYQKTANERLLFQRLICTAFDRPIPNDFLSTLPLSDNHSPNVKLLNLISNIQNFSNYSTNHNNERGIKNEGNKIQRKIIVLYPGSGGNADLRRWRIENFYELAEKLLLQGHVIIIAGGPDEVSLNPIINQWKLSYLTTEYGVREATKNRFFNLINQLSLFDWHYFLQRHVDLFVGNDGGLLHLAETSGVRTIGLFGPSCGYKWGSIRSDSVIIEVPANSLNCRPCIRTAEAVIPNKCQRGDVACLRRITPDQVLEQVVKLL